MPTIRHDIEALAESQGIAATLTQAAELVTLRRREALAAQRAADALRSRLSSGDDTVTAGDLVTADAEVERSQALQAHAVRRQTILSTRRPVESYAFADAVASRLLPVLGVDVTVTTSKPNEWPRVTSTPRAYLVQAKGANVEGGGVLAAEFDLYLVASSKLVRLPIVDVGEALGAKGWLVDLTDRGQSVDGKLYVHRAVVRVERGWLPLPELTTGQDVKPLHRSNDIGTGGLDIFADIVLGDLQDAARKAGSSLRNPGANVAKVTRSTHDGVHTDRYVVELAGEWGSRGLGRVAMPPLTAVLVEILDDLVGELIPGWGIFSAWGFGDAGNGFVEVRVEVKHAERVDSLDVTQDDEADGYSPEELAAIYGQDDDEI